MIASMIVAVSPGPFLIAVAIDAALATLVFWHADKHGNTHATRWGAFTFLFAGIAIPIYFLRYWLRRQADR